ncbi:MAG: hypothetical protein MUC73_08100 [Cyclobacteriaceae bacterium]|nr:hypothetical protein [Cyclobacteriaceae bacterium]
MDTKGILSHITRHVTLSDEEKLFFTSILIPVKLKQGEFAEKAGEILPPVGGQRIYTVSPTSNHPFTQRVH